MFPKIPARLLLVTILSIFATTSIAQPQLPDMAGALEKGVMVLTWTCQYDGIKSIAVQRSSDSIHNYATVGYVKNIKKGVQAFVDGHPAPGNNWYQLYIIFNSGLTWNSNRLKLHIDTATLLNLQYVLPPNDSLQRLIVTNEPKPKPKKSKSGMVVMVDSTKTKEDTTSKPSVDVTAIIARQKGDIKEKDENVVVSTIVTKDTSAQSKTAIITNDSVTMAKVHHITLALDNNSDEVNPYSYIKSQHVFTNPLTGHVNLELPEAKGHFYSIKFYDASENLIMEVPRITHSKIIIDKRNFQKKGIFKFELRKDNAQFETGYVTIY